ncbi:hypothetical protein [Deinococcus alpinitundrae]|uniref:hypothetical protein n=1 Tax=Deinococcus alpinitundrae TaxID=468913 RepID=UPI00137AFFD4|nr:hypothetical protein [Deinococcus alpinitundrae]
MQYLYLISLGRGWLNWWGWMRRSGTVVLALYGGTFAVLVLISIRQSLPPPHLPVWVLAGVAVAALLSGSLGRWPPFWLDRREVALLLTPLPTRQTLVWPLLRAVAPGVGVALLLGVFLLIFSQGWQPLLLLPALMLARPLLGWLTYLARQTPRSAAPVWALSLLPALGSFGWTALGLSVLAVLVLGAALGWPPLRHPPARLAQHAQTLWLWRLRRKYKLPKTPLRMEQARPARRPLRPFPATWGAAGAMLWRTSLQIRTSPEVVLLGAAALAGVLIGFSLPLHLPALVLAGALTLGAEPLTRSLGSPANVTWPVSRGAAWLGQVLPGGILGGGLAALAVLIGMVVLHASVLTGTSLVLVALLLPISALSLTALLTRWTGSTSVEVRIGSAAGVAILTAGLWAVLPPALLGVMPLSLLGLTLLTWGLSSVELG